MPRDVQTNYILAFLRHRDLVAFGLTNKENLLVSEQNGLWEEQLDEVDDRCEFSCEYIAVRLSLSIRCDPSVAMCPDGVDGPSTADRGMTRARLRGEEHREGSRLISKTI